MEGRKQALMRLKKVLLNDKTLPSGLLGVLTSDLNNVLEGYFDFDKKYLSIELDMNQDGKFVLNISTVIDRVKSVKVL